MNPISQNSFPIQRKLFSNKLRKNGTRGLMLNLMIADFDPWEGKELTVLERQDRIGKNAKEK